MLRVCSDMRNFIFVEIGAAIAPCAGNLLFGRAPRTIATVRVLRTVARVARWPIPKPIILGPKGSTLRTFAMPPSFCNPKDRPHTALLPLADFWRWRNPWHYAGIHLAEIARCGISSPRKSATAPDNPFSMFWFRLSFCLLRSGRRRVVLWKLLSCCLDFDCLLKKCRRLNLHALG